MSITNDKIYETLLAQHTEQREAADRIWDELRQQDGRLREFESRGAPKCDEHAKRLGECEVKLAKSSGKTSVVDKLMLIAGGGMATVLATGALELVRKLFRS